MARRDFPVDPLTSRFAFDPFLEFEAPVWRDLSAQSLESETCDGGGGGSVDPWFSREHALHSLRAAASLKLRAEQQKKNPTRFTPQRLAGPGGAPLSLGRPAPSTDAPSPGRPAAVVAKKLNFASPERGSSRKRGAGDVRVVGSGPFGEARQKAARRGDDTEGVAPPDLVSLAPVPPFDATARRLVFQLSPTGPAVVTAVRAAGTAPTAATPPRAHDMLAELERLTISSGGKVGGASKRRAPATSPAQPRSLRLGGGASRVAAGPGGAAEAWVLPDDDEEASRKRSRVAGANVLSKMGPPRHAATGSGRVAAPAAAPAARGSRRGAGGGGGVGVDDVVRWEKRTGRSWHKLTLAEKQRELEEMKKGENAFPLHDRNVL